MKETIASWLFDNGPVRAAVAGVLSSLLFVAAVAVVVLVSITAPAVMVSVWAVYILSMGALWGLSNRKIRQFRREFQRKYGT